MGVSDKELSRFTSDGRLTRIGRGVYRIKHHVPGNLDPYAESVALAGPGAYLYGESVLAMFALCPTNPAKMHIGTPRRIRRKLPEGMKVVQPRTLPSTRAYPHRRSWRPSARAWARSCPIGFGRPFGKRGGRAYWGKTRRRNSIGRCQSDAKETEQSHRRDRPIAVCGE